MPLLSDDTIAGLCARQTELTILFAASWAGLALTVASLLVFDLSGTSHVVAVLNVPGLVGMIVWTGYVLHRCRDGVPYGRGEPGP